MLSKLHYLLYILFSINHYQCSLCMFYLIFSALIVFCLCYPRIFYFHFLIIVISFPSLVLFYSENIFYLFSLFYLSQQCNFIAFLLAFFNYLLFKFFDIFFFNCLILFKIFNNTIFIFIIYCDNTFCFLFYLMLISYDDFTLLKFSC